MPAQEQGGGELEQRAVAGQRVSVGGTWREPEYESTGPIGAKPLLDELTAVDLERGVSLYAMVDNWRGWVNRRVERVELIDAVASRRYISLDCTLRERYKLRAADGNEHFYVPLSLHEKRRVTRFSVRDESGRALPILTQARSAYLGTVTLAVAALGVWTEVKGPWQTGLIAPDVLADLDYIATQDWRSALARLRVLADVPSTQRDDRERELRELGGKPIATLDPRQALIPCTDNTLDLSRQWRHVLTSRRCSEASAMRDPAAAFGDLAHDFAHNFLIVALVSDAPRLRVDDSRLDVHAAGSQDARGGQAPEPPMAEQLAVPTGTEQHRLLKMSFEEQRRVPPPYVLGGLRRAMRPSAIIATGASKLRRGWWLLVYAVCFPLTGRRSIAAALLRVIRGARTLIRKGERALAVRPKIFSVPTPAIGRCDCYHLEVEAPEGLQITGAELRPLSPVEREGLGGEVDRVTRSVQRVHLHLAGVHQAASGEARIALRPRTWNDLMPACVAGTMTVALLVWIGSSWDALGESKMRATGLLLTLPAALGFFVSRKTEAGLVTSVLRGVRVLAFLTGAYALMGVAVVLADDDCARRKADWLWSDHSTLSCGPNYLWMLSVLALLTLLPLAVATVRAWDPPLRRDIDDDGEDFDPSQLSPGRAESQDP
jgi:hypothetical protein